MDIYREINNSSFANTDTDIILKHIYHTSHLSVDDLSLEDALMYDEDREEFYPMCTISLYDLERSVKWMNSSIECWSARQDMYRNSVWIDKMKEARDIFQKEINEQDNNSYYIVKFE